MNLHEEDARDGGMRVILFHYFIGLLIYLLIYLLNIGFNGIPDKNPEREVFLFREERHLWPVVSSLSYHWSLPAYSQAVIK